MCVFRSKPRRSEPLCRCRDIKDAFLSIISTLKFRDVIDVVILAYVIYILLKLIRETRAGQLVKGIILLVAGYFISDFLDSRRSPTS